MGCIAENTGFDAAKRPRKDRALLSTYTTEKEIDLARDRALEHHKGIITGAQARLKQLEPSAKQLDQKVKAATRGGKPAPAHLQHQYEAKQAEVAEVQRIIKTNEDAMVAVRERLRGGQAAFP